MQNKGVLIKNYISDSLCSFLLSLVCLFQSSLKLLMINCSHKSIASLLESRQLTPCTQVPYSFSQTQFCFYFHYLSFYFIYRYFLQFSKIIWNFSPNLKDVQHLWWCVLLRWGSFHLGMESNILSKCHRMACNWGHGLYNMKMRKFILFLQAVQFASCLSSSHSIILSLAISWTVITCGSVCTSFLSEAEQVCVEHYGFLCVLIYLYNCINTQIGLLPYIRCSQSSPAH